MAYHIKWSSLTCINILNTKHLLSIHHFISRNVRVGKTHLFKLKTTTTNKTIPKARQARYSTTSDSNEWREPIHHLVNNQKQDNITYEYSTQNYLEKVEIQGNKDKTLSLPFECSTKVDHELSKWCVKLRFGII